MKPSMRKMEYSQCNMTSSCHRSSTYKVKDEPFIFGNEDVTAHFFADLSGSGEEFFNFFEVLSTLCKVSFEQSEVLCVYDLQHLIGALPPLLQCLA